MEQLELSARRAYEGARLRAGILWALPLTVLAFISLRASHEHVLTLAVTAVAAANMIWLVKRGQALGSGARIGLFAGLVPYVVSLCARDSRHFITPLGHVHGCVIACGIACAVMTLVLSRTAAGQRQWISATWTMLTVATIACACVGVSGVALLVAMVAVAVAPVRILVRST